MEHTYINRSRFGKIRPDRGLVFDQKSCPKNSVMSEGPRRVWCINGSHSCACYNKIRLCTRGVSVWPILGAYTRKKTCVWRCSERWSELTKSIKSRSPWLNQIHHEALLSDKICEQNVTFDTQSLTMTRLTNMNRFNRLCIIAAD